MTIGELTALLGGLPPSTEIVFRSGMGVSAIHAAQLVRDLRDDATRVHLTLNPDLQSAGYIDPVTSRMLDTFDRLAPKREPWEDQDDDKDAEL